MCRDLLRNATTNGFASAACVATRITVTTATGAKTLAMRHYYRVRAKNACGGNLGSSSNRTPRTGAACP